MATENAVATLGKVLEFHGSVLEGSAAAQSWDLWINSLPLVEDKVEARHVHAQLVRHIQASDARYALLPVGDCAVSVACGHRAVMNCRACVPLYDPCGNRPKHNAVAFLLGNCCLVKTPWRMLERFFFS